MKTRKLVLIIVDVVLLAVCIIQGIFSSIDPSKTFSFTETPDEVHIYSPSRQIDLISSDGGNTWVIGKEKYPANSLYVSGLIDKFSTIHATNKVGSVKNEAAINRFELDETSCISVVAKKDGKLLRSIQIGKSPAGVQKVYATIDGEKDIYLVEGNLRTAFDYEEDYLREKTIYSLDEASIKSVEYTDINGVKTTVPDDKKADFSIFTTDTFKIPEDLSQAVKKYSVTIQADKTVTMDIYEIKKDGIPTEENPDPKPEYTYIGTSSECPYKFNVPRYNLTKFGEELE